MEITNNSRHYSIPLVVGRRVAQIVFFDSDGTEGCDGFAVSLMVLIMVAHPSLCAERI